MKAVAYGIAAFLALIGLMILMAAPRGFMFTRLVVGVVLLGASYFVVTLARKPIHHTHVHKMELDVTGDVNLEQITCKQCGAELSSDSVSVAAGAVYVKCEYCGAQYQIEEAPKW